MSGSILIIQNAQPADAGTIRELAISANIDAWSVAHYLEEIARPDSFLIKATESERLIGFLLARAVPGADGGSDAELYNIAVDNHARRKGIAGMLLAELVSRLKALQIIDLWLEVRESNIPAIEFYKKHGFEGEITRTNFYSTPVENAVVMRRRISPRSDVSEA